MYNHDLIHYLLKRFDISSSQTVLDIGFGDGYLLQNLNCKTHGIEKGNDFIEMDFDYIFMLDVIEHLTQKQVQDYFEYFERTIKPNGKIIISTPNINNLYQNILFWDEPTHIRPYTKQTMYTLAEEHGFFIDLIPFHFFKNPLKILTNALLGLDYYNKNVFELTKKEPYTKRWKRC